MSTVEIVHVDNEGLDLAVRVAGPVDGPPVVLIHGFPDTAAIWSHQISHLAARGHRVIAPDTRGCGASGRPSDPTAYALADLIGDFLAICRHLDVERTAVVGHDLGAALTWVIGARLGAMVDRIAALTVGYPAGFGDDDLDQLQRLWYILLFQDAAGEDFLRDRDWRGLAMLAPDHPDRAEVERRLRDPDALTAALAWYRNNIPPSQFIRFDADAPRVQAPTLALWGSADPILGERQMTRSKQFVDGPWTYRRVEGAGHWFQVTAADEVNEALGSFLAR